MKAVCLKFDKFPVLESMHNKFALLEKDAYALEVQYEETWHNALIEKSKALTNELDAFCEQEYSKAVFDVFSKIAPKIVKMDGEHYDWSQVFGSDYFGCPANKKAIWFR